MEENPFAAARTNVLGTQQVAQVSSAFGADKMILISTDKAVSPIGIMGATKRIAELVVLGNRGATQMNSVRLGNVLGSTGSVVPTLQRQIAQGGPITLTDSDCTRYFVSINEAVRLLLSALLIDSPSTVFTRLPKSCARRDGLDRFPQGVCHTFHIVAAKTAEKGNARVLWLTYSVKGRGQRIGKSAYAG